MVYREPYVPESDDEIEALADLARRTRRLKLWTVVPLILSTAASVVFAVGLHLGGQLALGSAPDGSYYVSKGSICLVAALAAAAAFGPGWLLMQGAQALSHRNWRKAAERRYKLDAATLDALLQLFSSPDR